MNREFIKKIIDHPYEKQSNKMERGSFYIEEIFQNYNEGKYIKGELQCGVNDP